MRPPHLVAMLALVLTVNISEAHPTFSSIDMPFASQMDDVDMSILHRAMRAQVPNECDLQEEVRELCQRCAKATKSAAAYPLCCKPREPPRLWCIRYLAFGIGTLP